MTQGLRELQPQDLSAELERALLPVLVGRLKGRGTGHCMRISDLDPELMVRLCGRLRAEVTSATVVVLTDGVQESVPEGLAVTSTKLVELRNPFSDGTLRPPLLVFVPNDVRAAAEDSFGVATFEDVNVGDVYERLRKQLLTDAPTSVRGSLTECLARLTEPSEPWPFADAVAVARFLLTAKVNGADSESYGGALYELGLVPDFELFSDPVQAPTRIARNRECVGKLTWSPHSERGRVLDLGLSEHTFRNQLGEFLAETGVEDPRIWTRRIVVEQKFWPLAFNRWEFEDDGGEPDAVFVGDVTTDLPTVEDDVEDRKLGQLIGQQILPLGRGGLRRFSVRFHVDPHPTKVRGLVKFVLQVISREQGPVGLVRSKAAWKGTRQSATVSFNMLNKVEWEEGWHFVRVLAQTEDDEFIPLLDHGGAFLPWRPDDSAPGVAPPNESEFFYVLPGGEVEVEPPQRAVQREASLSHAQLRLQFTALLDHRDPDSIRSTSVRWAERTRGRRASVSEMLEAKFGREGSVHIPVSRTLKEIEQGILAAPDDASSWHLSIKLGVAGSPICDHVQWPEGEAARSFLDARSRYFEALRSGSGELVTQAADLRVLRDLVSSYASAYLVLVQQLSRRTEMSEPLQAQRALSDLRRVLAVDSISLSILDHRDRQREATLVSPTHPLRALWLATWAELGTSWLKAAKAAPREFAIGTRDALLRHLAPNSYPPVLPTASGHVLTAVDNLNPFWSLYSPSHEEDPRGLVGDICSAFGLPEPGFNGAIIDGVFLASRVRRYLLQHPYVRTLVINAFNAGRGAVLAGMLLELQKEPAFADLRYDVRLFVPDAEAPGVGAALTELLSPTASVAAREADAFSTPTESHLRPKLRIATRPTGDFRSAPDMHSAHLSLLFDVFPTEDVGATQATLREASSPVHGLIQDFHVEYHEDESVIVWRRQPRHGLAAPLTGAEELTDLLASLSVTLSNTTATVATGQTGFDSRPVVTLALRSEDRALLHQVHEISDWVLTLDRNMGIEFFDHGGKAGRPDYLIDYAPEVIGTSGHRLVITSRSIAELEAMLRPVLEPYGLQADGRHAVAILDQLRSLSGRLALKLISSTTQGSEALGLALSRIFLEHQGVFENQIVVPLDAHLELYRGLAEHSDEVGDEVSFKRTDLALFDLDAARRLITCRLVEVKCYNGVGDVGAYNRLKGTIADQIRRSQDVLSRNFDPYRTSADRPDRLLKTHQFVILLEFYLDRADRYSIVSPEAAEEARFFLRTLESGYRLEFTRSALIFDFEKPGTEPPENDGGIEYYRIGVNLIEELIEAAAPHTETSTSESGELVASEPPRRGAEAVCWRRERAPSVTTLDTAAFLGSPRSRSVSWEELRAQRTLGESKTLDEVSDHEASPGTVAEVDVSAPKADKSTSQVTAVTEDERRPTTAEFNAADAPGESRVLTEESTTGHEDDGLRYDVLLGTNSPSPQYGILGEFSGRRVAMDLNQTHTISLFGVQGGGKSYTLGTLAEMASLAIPNINRLPRPLATVIFHYSPTMDYPPEFTSMVAPNSDEVQQRALRETFGAASQALSDLVLLAPADKVEDRRSEHPGIDIFPLKFAATELQTNHWRFLMGAVGNQATYIRQLNRVIKSLRDDLTLVGLRQGIDASRLPDHLKEMARMRLDLAAEYIDDSARLQSLIRPGRVIIVDLRDEFIEKDEALGLFVVLLQLFSDAKHEGESFNKLVVFDEAHKYIESTDLVAGLIEVVREMRHKGTSIMVASQDPSSLPVPLIELSSQIILHKFNSPAWLKHIQKANAALGGLTPENMAQLRPGEAYVWSSKATDEAFTNGAVKVQCRPRVTQHGGATRTAVEGQVRR